MNVVQLSPAPGVQIVAADHPSLDREVAGFLAGLATEPRYFGPSAAANPKPFPSLIQALGANEGFRLAAVERGQMIGLVRVDPSGDAYIAVAAERRGAGIGTALGRAALDRAIGLGYTRIVLRASRRSRAARRVGEALGCIVVDRGRGRTDLIVDLHDTRASA
jgi:GNAT superfamily N-acetyltransferase